MGLEAHFLEHPRDVVQRADILCTLTPSVDPIVHAEDLHPGLHVNAVGSPPRPRYRELATDVLASAHLVVDSAPVAAEESGVVTAAIENGSIDEHALVDLGEVLSGHAVGRSTDREVTAFVSVGLGIQDLAAVSLILDTARQRAGDTTSPTDCDPPTPRDPVTPRGRRRRRRRRRRARPRLIHVRNTPAPVTVDGQRRRPSRRNAGGRHRRDDSPSGDRAFHGAVGLPGDPRGNHPRRLSPPAAACANATSPRNCGCPASPSAKRYANSRSKGFVATSPNRGAVVSQLTLRGGQPSCSTCASPWKSSPRGKPPKPSRTVAPYDTPPPGRRRGATEPPWPRTPTAIRPSNTQFHAQTIAMTGNAPPHRHHGAPARTQPLAVRAHRRPRPARRIRRARHPLRRFHLQRQPRPGRRPRLRPHRARPSPFSPGSPRSCRSPDDALPAQRPAVALIVNNSRTNTLHRVVLA